MTLHELEALANEITEEQTTTRQKLARMIRAFAKIIAAREPKKFSRFPTEYSDEDGHWDNSYPPKQEYKQYIGPHLITIIDSDRQSKATSGGFYHSIEYFTEDGGLFIGVDGEFYQADEHGTGSFGQFAAHPGECNVIVKIDYNEIEIDDIPLDRLAKAEKELRAVAFPLVAAQSG